MKTCSGCGLSKDFAEFPTRPDRNSKPRSKCRSCINEYQRDFYISGDNQRAKRLKTKHQNIGERRKVLLRYLLDHPCVDCGERDVIVLEFDHKDGSDKTYDICKMVQRGFGLAKIMAEIAKCDVRCANCHKRRTSKQFSWWKSLDLPTSHSTTS